MKTSKKTHIVIVGGGAGGLELAARLSRIKNIKKNADLILVDANLKHVWKPLLHEAATGTLFSSEDEIDYISYASGRFRFEYGRVNGLDRKNKTILVEPLFDDQGHEILPQRKIHYDTLVLAIGSISNDFNIPGVDKYCVFLDSLQQAEVLNKLLIQHIIQLLSISNSANKPFNIAIVGGGATGVELAAEIRYAMAEIEKLGIPASAPLQKVHISVIESAKRILPQLPERLSKAAKRYLKEIGIALLTDKLVTKVKADGIETRDGSFISADLKIWSAGIKIDPVVMNFDGLELNKINQIIVNTKLQTTNDASIYAFGDCAACPQKDSKGEVKFVPPRAQAAHQQATLLAKSISRQLAGKSALDYTYSDYGSLITISKYYSLGNIMNRLAKNLYIEGKLARLSYWFLYKKHQAVLWGTWRVITMTLANFISSRVRPKLKLH